MAMRRLLFLIGIPLLMLAVAAGVSVYRSREAPPDAFTAFHHVGFAVDAEAAGRFVGGLERAGKAQGFSPRRTGAAGKAVELDSADLLVEVLDYGGGRFMATFQAKGKRPDDGLRARAAGLVKALRAEFRDAPGIRFLNAEGALGFARSLRLEGNAGKEASDKLRGLGFECKAISEKPDWPVGESSRSAGARQFVSARQHRIECVKAAPGVGEDCDRLRVILYLSPWKVEEKDDAAIVARAPAESVHAQCEVEREAGRKPR